MYCPVCTALVELITDCPGYGDNDVTIRVCYPACSNMTVAECECGWRWTDVISKRQSYLGWHENAPPIGWARPIEPILDLARHGPGTVAIHLVMPKPEPDDG